MSKKTSILKTAILSIFAVVFFGCSSDVPVPEPVPDDDDDLVRFVNLSDEEMRVIDKVNDFSFGLYKQVAASEKDNFMISPLSLSLSMSMVAAGADGETRREIMEALDFTGLNAEQVNRVLCRLKNVLINADKKCAFSVANSMWLDNSLLLNPGFGDLAKECEYDIFQCDMHSEKALSDINSWSANHTWGAIPGLLEHPLADDCKLGIMSAVYFDGMWEKAFDEANTVDREFHNIDGSVSAIPTMHDEKRICGGFYDNNGAVWVKMLCGNCAFEVVLILPNSIDDDALDRYMGKLSTVSMQNCFDMMTSYEFDMELPKFAISSSHDFRDAVASMGVDAALSPKADFSNLTNNKVMLSAVLQKTSINIDEKGRRTTDEFVFTGSDVLVDTGFSVHKEIAFDRPFAFMVYERSSRLVVFMGRISKL